MTKNSGGGMSQHVGAGTELRVGVESAEGRSAFLQKELDQISESFWRNEETGESRVRFFITFVTAVLTALVALGTIDPSKAEFLGALEVQWIMIYALACLLIIGVMTWLRMVHRNCVTDEYKEAMDLARGYLTASHPSLRHYNPFPKGKINRLPSGGLVHFVAAVNGLLIVALIYLLGITLAKPYLLEQQGLYLKIGLGLAAGLVAYVSARYLSWKGSQVRKQAKDLIGFRHGEEVEAAVAIMPPRATQTADQIAGLRELAGYRLLARPSITLTDTYWDFRDRQGERRLAGKRFALRLRECGSRSLITLKGPSRRDGAAGVRRTEIEEAWSKGALKKILSILKGQGVKLPGKIVFGPWDDPRETLTSLGFQQIQQRTTERHPRDVIAKGFERGPVVAELSTDRTRFQVGDKRIQHFEVEIEAKGPAGWPAIAELLDALLFQHKDVLRPWDYGKLVTGNAIQALHASTGLLDRLGEDQALDRKAYDLLEEQLEREAT